LATDSPPYPDTKPRAFRFTPLMESMLDDLVQAGLYLNDSEAVRAAVLLLYESKSGYCQKVGPSSVYNREKQLLSEKNSFSEPTLLDFRAVRRENSLIRSLNNVLLHHVYSSPLDNNLDNTLFFCSVENNVLKVSDFVLSLYFLCKRYLIRRTFHAVFVIDIGRPPGERNSHMQHFYFTFFSLSPISFSQLQEVKG
jgi:hypothetical protein